MPRQDNIWASGQVASVQPEPEAASVQTLPNDYLRGGILGADLHHLCTALRRGRYVDHILSVTQLVS